MRRGLGRAGVSPRPRSLLMAGAASRVAGVTALIALLWLAVGWATGRAG